MVFGFWSTVALGRSSRRISRRSFRRTSTKLAWPSAQTLPSLMPPFKTSWSAKAMVFNKPETTPFRDALLKAGFYDEWKRKFGDEAWALLNKTVGGGLS